MFFFCSFIRSYNAIGLSLARTFFYLYTRVLFAWYQLQVRYTLSVLSVHTENHIELVCVCAFFFLFVHMLCVSLDFSTRTNTLAHIHGPANPWIDFYFAPHQHSAHFISSTYIYCTVQVGNKHFSCYLFCRWGKTTTQNRNSILSAGCIDWLRSMHLIDGTWMVYKLQRNSIFFFISFLLLERLSVSVCHSPT